MTSRAVLVADDNLTVQRTAFEMLSREGLDVVTVANGMAAIKKLPEVKPLVVLADADMPGKDGYEVCDFVKKQPDLHYVRVLLAVSDSDPFDPVRGAEAGVDGVVKKPFDRDNLVSAIVRSLGEAEALCPPPPQRDADPPNPWDWQPGSLSDAPGGEPLLPDPLDRAEFDGMFTPSSLAPSPRDFPVEFAESSGPPIVEWVSGPIARAAEVNLEPPTPASGNRFAEEQPATTPGLMQEGTEPHEPSGKTSETASPIDLALVAAVVRSVVDRMAPPALSEECRRDLERALTKEIALEMTQPAPATSRAVPETGTA